MCMLNWHGIGVLCSMFGLASLGQVVVVNPTSFVTSEKQGTLKNRVAAIAHIVQAFNNSGLSTGFSRQLNSPRL